MKHYFLLYIGTLVVMTLLDMVWIGGIAREFYRSRIANLEFHAVPAVLFYLLYAAGVVLFVNGRTGATLQPTLLFGACFGLVAYATYDLTNLATLRGWSLSLSIVDMIWGAVVTALGASAGLLFVEFIERS